MLPEELTWEDGTPYTIDRILNVKPSVARKAGGQGDCYTILVNGKQSHLFFERSTNLTGAYIGRMVCRTENLNQNHYIKR